MRALVIVDVQNDFFPGGALAIQQADLILPPINKLIQKPFTTIVASKDWHPQDHISFASRHGKVAGEKISVDGEQQMLWPDHCIQETHGSEFAPGWDQAKIHKIFHKGSDREIDSYSTFFDNRHKRETGLAQFLHDRGTKEVYIAGLATDYCILYSVRDALHLGFTTFVVQDACRAVEVKQGDGLRAQEEMRSLGAHLIFADSIA